MVPPVSKRLACGDVGEGAMASPADVAAAVQAALAVRAASAGLRLAGDGRQGDVIQ